MTPWVFLPLPSLLLQLVSRVNGSVDDRGICQCSVFLPEDAFPAQQVEALEKLAGSLSERFNKELSKVKEDLILGMQALGLLNH